MRDTSELEFLALQEALAGRYSIERELGRGGMGVVYLAREVRLDRPVALKLLPAAFASRRDARERFLREARTAARLSHPHIVPIHAVDEVGDFVFMVMAYVEGQTLEQRVRERGPMPVSEAARVLRDVAWALAHAHAQGIVHRDVKPANILLEAGSERALVSDFGIAHVMDSPALTGTAEIIGTAEYMSPEQAAGEAVDGRSDLYALGIVGYFMLSGRLPFEGPTVAATLAKQLTQAPAPLAGIAPNVPLTIAQAIDRCLAKDPAARFQDGKQLADVVGQALERRTRVPAALRMFSERVGDALPAMLVLSGISAGFFVTAILINDAPVAGFRVSATLFGLIFGTAPLAMLTYMARRLLRSGYGHDELIRALRLEVEERRDALAHERPAEPTRFERLLSRGAIVGLLVSSSNSVYMMFGPYFRLWETLINPIMIVIATGSLSAGIYAATQHSLRTGRASNRWLRFWDSRFGRALFRLAGIKLGRPVNTGASYRPTELAIGMAADRLFDQLPEEIRKSLGELPAVVRMLEQHAEKMRARIAELAGILNDVEQQRGGQLIGAAHIGEKRDTLKSDVVAAREAAERRLAEVVAALEGIRLQLLRLLAGVGSVQGITADLTSARELSHDLDHLLEAKREVDELLGKSSSRSPGNTPVPA